jgi:response regulator of citrate/malate metabolism
MANRRRGKPSNNQLPDGLARYALSIIRERYADFGPTLACEKLAELHDVHLSKETVRSLMVKAGFWVPVSNVRQKFSSHAIAGPVVAN